VDFLRSKAFYDASISNNDLKITGVLAHEPLIKPFRLSTSGRIHKQELEHVVQWLSKYTFQADPGRVMDDFCKSMLKAFPKDKGLGLRLYQLKMPFVFVASGHFKEVVEHLAPHLQELAGVAGLWFVSRSVLSMARHAAIRALYTIQHIPDFFPAKRAGIKGFETLQHLESMDDLGVSDKLNLFFALFSPYICGTSTDRVGGTVVFLLPELHDFRTSFPTRLQDILRTDLSPFAEDKEVEGRGKAVRITFSKEELTALFRYYISNLERLEEILLDPTRFAKPDNTLDTRRWLLTNLSVHRMFRDTLNIQIEYLSQYLRKTLSFHFIDAVAQTMKQSARFAQDGSWTETRIFKALLSRMTLIEGLGSRLKEYPAPFGNYFRNRARRAGEELHKKLLAGMFIPARRTVGKIRVGTDHLSIDEYITSVLREIRNTYHGYNINRFEVLEIHNGNLPDCLGDLPVLFMLAFLQEPEMILDAKLIP